MRLRTMLLGEKTKLSQDEKGRERFPPFFMSEMRVACAGMMCPRDICACCARGICDECSDACNECGSTECFECLDACDHCSKLLCAKCTNALVKL